MNRSSYRIRLNKFLARAGVGSRRKCDEFIRSGRITVNGAKVLKLGVKIQPWVDRVTFDGKPVKIDLGFVYLVLNKPPGYLVSAEDRHGRRIVFDLLGGLPTRVFPVGRLDLDTAGILLLTNDGELAFRLIHPKYQVEKEYEVLVAGILDSDDLERLRKGVRIQDAVTAPAKVTLKRINGGNAVLEMVLHEGRKRQVKRMCRAVGHPVLHLRRFRFAGITAEGLSLGAWRYLTRSEIEGLRAQVGMRAWK